MLLLSQKCPRTAVLLAVRAQAYQADEFPQRPVREALARQVGKSVRQVQVWFQNRRQRDVTRKERQADYAILPPEPDPTGGACVVYQTQQCGWAGAQPGSGPGPNGAAAGCLQAFSSAECTGAWASATPANAPGYNRPAGALQGFSSASMSPGRPTSAPAVPSHSSAAKPPAAAPYVFLNGHWYKLMSESPPSNDAQQWPQGAPQQPQASGAAPPVQSPAGVAISQSRSAYPQASDIYAHPSAAATATAAAVPSGVPQFFSHAPQHLRAAHASRRPVASGHGQLQPSSHPVASPQLQHAHQVAQQQQLAPKQHAQQLQHHLQPQAHLQAAGAPPPFGADFVNSAMATYSERVPNPPSMPGSAAAGHQSAGNPLAGTCTSTLHPLSAPPPEYSAEAVAVAAPVLPGQEIARDGAFGADSAAYGAGVAYAVSDDCGPLSSQLSSHLASSHPNGSGSTMPSISAPPYATHSAFVGYAPSVEPYADAYMAEQALSPEQTLLSPSLLG